MRCHFSQFVGWIMRTRVSLSWGVESCGYDGAARCSMKATDQDHRALRRRFLHDGKATGRRCFARNDGFGDGEPGCQLLLAFASIAADRSDDNPASPRQIAKAIVGTSRSTSREESPVPGVRNAHAASQSVISVKAALNARIAIPIPTRLTEIQPSPPEKKHKIKTR